jgi:hypothetical protein
MRAEEEVWDGEGHVHPIFAKLARLQKSRGFLRLALF